jgi:hypothetical protein
VAKMKTITNGAAYLFNYFFGFLKNNKAMRSAIPGIRGHVEIEVRSKDGREVYRDRGDNIILSRGKEEIMALLWEDSSKTIPPDPSRELGGSVKSLSRIAVGDGGADPSTLLTPKSLDSSRTTLFNEVWRQDFDSPGGISHPSSNSLRCVATVESAGIPASRFNSSNNGYYLNEAGLVISVPGIYTNGNPDPATPDANEILFSHKAFKSFPFDPGLSMTATFYWTVYIVL